MLGKTATVTIFHSGVIQARKQSTCIARQSYGLLRIDDSRLRQRTMSDRRRADLTRHLEELRKNDGWHPFQHFVIGLLPHAGYTDVRHSNPRSDLGRDAVAITPDGKRCVVAVSFECT